MKRHRPYRIRRINLRTVSADPDDQTRPLRLACYAALLELTGKVQGDPVYIAATVRILRRAIRGES